MYIYMLENISIVRVSVSQFPNSRKVLIIYFSKMIEMCSLVRVQYT
jgi:hypothetical protein